MKLAKIEHERCGEYSETTYVWIPDEMSQDVLNYLAGFARSTMLKAEDAFNAAPDAPKNPGWAPEYGKHPDKTVSEVQAEHKQALAIYKEWEERKKSAKATFGSVLAQVSEGKIKNFYDHKLEMSAVVSWGHRHGQKFDHSPTDPNANDINAPKTEEDDYL